MSVIYRVSKYDQGNVYCPILVQDYGEDIKEFQKSQSVHENDLAEKAENTYYRRRCELLNSRNQIAPQYAHYGIHSKNFHGRVRMVTIKRDNRSRLLINGCCESQRVRKLYVKSLHALFNFPELSSCRIFIGKEM